MAPWPHARLAAALGPAARGRGIGKGRGAGAELGAPHLQRTWTSAARLSTKEKIAFIVGILMFEWLVADGGPVSLGAAWEPRGVSPGRLHPGCGSGLGGHRAAPLPAQRARGRGGAPGCRRAWVRARVGGAAARTPSSKLPVDHPRGRPGPPGGRPARARARARPAAETAGVLRFAM